MWQSKMFRETTHLKQSEIRLLTALQNTKPGFTEFSYNKLKEKTGLSNDSLSKSLKSLQLPEKNPKIKRSVTTRNYAITKEGTNWLTIKETTNLITNSSVEVKTDLPLPINTIVAIDAPTLQKAQRNTVMNGTKDIARMVFDQLLSDIGTGKKLPDSGRLAYTATIDLKKVKDWLDSAEGKKYKITPFDSTKDRD